MKPTYPTSLSLNEDDKIGQDAVLATGKSKIDIYRRGIRAELEDMAENQQEEKSI